VVARFLWPLLISVAVIIAVVVSSAGDETRTKLEYLDAIGSQAQSLARSGAILEDVMNRVDQIDREEFTTVLDGVKEDIDAAVDFVAEEPPTRSLVPVWALYRQAVQAWERGVDGLAFSILQAADDPQDDTIVNAVGEALADLRAGDRLFEDLQVEFQREEIPDPASPLVVVQMSPSDTGLFSQSVSYVAAARRSTTGLGLRPGLKVSQVVSEPAWEVNVEDQAVIPATDTVGFSAVITNSGNVASEPESVRLQLSDGGPEPVLATVAEVPILAPGGQTTIQFDPVEVTPDTLYEVLVVLDLTHPDADMTDNEIRVQFTVTPS
jgi:hypothetical protein